MVEDRINAKLALLRRCIARIETRLPADAEALLADVDTHDILSLNLQRAVQLAVDVSALVLARAPEPPSQRRVICLTCKHVGG